MAPAPFKGLVVAVSGTFRVKQAALKQIIEDIGGTFSPKVTDDCTHLVTTQKDVDNNSNKYQQARSIDNCHIVTLDWVLDSLANQRRMPEKSYTFDDSNEDSTVQTDTTDTHKKRSAQTEDGAPPVKKKKEEPTANNFYVPVDEGCKDSTAYEVYIGDDGTIWDASLNLTSASNNNNKFYRIQLLKSKTKNQYSSWTRWGRVGETGSGAMVGPCEFEVAKKSFEKKFREKSGLPWTDRLSEPKPGKYFFVERDYEEDDTDDAEAVEKRTKKKQKAEVDNKPDDQPAIESKLPLPIQEIVALIFNQEYALKALQDLNYDAHKMPLGKLSKRTLQTGFQALKDLSELINDPSLAADKYCKAFGPALETLSNRFFTIIPHAFGRNRPPVINNSSLLRKEVELLDNLMDMEIANQIFKESQTVDDEVHFLDKQYQGLKLEEMTPLSHASTEFEEIQKYLVEANGPSHHYDLKAEEIFRIERNGEYGRFEEAGFTNFQNDNRRLLWHGSRATNFGGILSQGLRIAPPEAPVNGYMFGKGVYFADISTKSAGFCCSYSSRGIGLLLLCEVQLGDPMQELQHASYTAGEDAKASGKLATLGLGSTIPLGWKDAGCVHPSLEGVMMPDVATGLGDSNKRGALMYNEYIVYDVAQIRQRYLLKVRMD